jgi:hypothetical protein
LRQDEAIALRWKLHQAETEVLALQDRLSGSRVHVAAASELSESTHAAALKLVIDVQHRDIESLRKRVASAELAAASANMDSIIKAARVRTAIAVAGALPATQQRSLQTFANLKYELHVQVKLMRLFMQFDVPDVVSL